MSSVLTRIFTSISEIKINTDKSLIFSKYDEVKTFKFEGSQFSTIDKNLDLEDPNRLAQVSIIVSGNTMIYFRSYKKVLELISNIGGFFNGVTYTVYLVLFLYSQNTILFHSISNIISEEEISDSLKKSIVEDIVKTKYFKPELIKIIKPSTILCRSHGSGAGADNLNELRDIRNERDREGRNPERENNFNLNKNFQSKRVQKEIENNRQEPNPNRENNRCPVNDSGTHLPVNIDNSNINQELQSQNRNNIDNSNNSRQ